MFSLSGTNFKSAKSVAGGVCCPCMPRRLKDINLVQVAALAFIESRLTVVAEVSSACPHCVTHSATNSDHLQSGASSQAKHGGAYFSAVSGSIKDLIAVPG